MMRVLLGWGVVCVVLWLGLCLIYRLDKPSWSISQKEYIMLMGWSAVNAIVLVLCFDAQLSETLLWAIFAGCLLLACITDWKACEVYQFTWWIAGSIAVLGLCGFMGEAETISMPQWVSLAVYCALQECFFARFYGRADCHAFVVCALVAYGIGMDFGHCLRHMFFAFCGLTVVQIFRRNIDKRGNLKMPIAFLPYITMAFWVNLGCFSLEKMVY